MITLDSASGYIDIPKVFNYDELMNKIKQTLQINEELFKYLYFSYIDEDEQERTRLIPQIFDDFVNQKNPKLSIGFLDNLNTEILEQLTDLIDANKKRFKEERDKIISEEEDHKSISENEEEEEKEKIIVIERRDSPRSSMSDEEKQKNNISSGENQKDIINNVEPKRKIEIDDENNSDGRIELKIEEDEKDNIISEKIIEKKEIKIDDENNNSINKREIDKKEIKIEEENENIISKEKKDEEIIEIKIDDKNEDLGIIKKESDFNLISSEINNGYTDNNQENYNNNKNENLDDSEYNLKVFEEDFNKNFDNLQKSMKNSNMEEYNKYKNSEEIKEKEFENNIKQIIESNADNIKNEIINSIIEASKIDNNPKQNKAKNKVVHNGIKCNNCGMFPIIGIRYKCIECDNYNFCEKCEKTRNPSSFL
jgi:hypothetical protein